MEEWRSIPDYPGYEISSAGRVRTVQGVPLKLWKSGIGYRSVGLRLGGKRTIEYVHRLVTRAFHGPPPAGRNDASHLNGVRHDNRADNLMWESRAENIARTEGHGTKLLGERANGAVLTADDVYAIRQRGKAGETQAVIAEDYPVTRHMIGLIIRRQRWGHLT
ncbi:NUMOD4 motif-containing HNH endonuclease [Streptomyces sp. NBC_01212]|uniref:NUMOD4 motif-containing HNH endonuclease n=1 Tax=Streptomyces sp. NBC_01212 TaxID=2903775 RepID=UPI002E133CFA|nr:NUMOD4 motif-containing HNH endonuclease [Streptomyces sp. NBC_01212]